jgi:hypothetical protein
VRPPTAHAPGVLFLVFYCASPSGSDKNLEHTSTPLTSSCACHLVQPNAHSEKLMVGKEGKERGSE